MEDIQQKIKKIKFSNCEINPEHSGNQKNMICVDKDCIGIQDRYLTLMCAMCVEENIHQKQNHIQKPFQKVISDIIKEVTRNKQENDKIIQKFADIEQFINCMKAAVVDEPFNNKVNSILNSLSESTEDNSTADQKFVDNLISLTHEIEYNEDTNEVSLKKNTLNQSIDSDNDSSVAQELFKDFVKLIDIFNQNSCQFDSNIILPLQGYRLLSDVKDSPLGSFDKEKMFKDAFRLDSVLINDVKRASGSRRQSLEMFEADKKILLLMNENDRLNFSLNAKQDEIDILKIKLQRAEDDLKQHPGKNPEEEDPQVKILQFELERVNKALEYKNKEIDSLYQRNSSKIAENGETIIELQAQIDMLIKENERLNSVICAKDEEIGSIQSVSNLEDKSTEGLKTEIKRLNKIVGEQNTKIESIQNENQQIINSKHQEINQQKEQYNSLLAKYSKFGIEVERLNTEVEQKAKEVEEWKGKIHKQSLHEIPIPEQKIELTKTTMSSSELSTHKPKQQSSSSTQQLQQQHQQPQFSYQPLQKQHQQVQQQQQQQQQQQTQQPQQSLQYQQHFASGYIPIAAPIHNTLPHYTQFNTQLSNPINPQKLFNNYGGGIFQPNTSQSYMNRERLGSEGQSLNHKLDQVKSANHIKKISAIDKIDIYKKNDYLQQPLSSRFKSPPSSGSKINQTNLTQTTVYINDSDFNSSNKNLITPTVNKAAQSGNYHVGSTGATDRKTSAPSNNMSSDDKNNTLSSSINYYKTYKQNSQFHSPPSSVQSIIPYKERIDSKIQNLSKEIGKLNNILDNREQPEKKPSLQQFHQSFLKNQNYRSGSEGLKNKSFK